MKVAIDAAAAPPKRKRHTNCPKLLVVGDNVEVRSLDEGFMGSWHSGVVIKCQNGIRKVQYDNVLCDDGSQRLSDCISVHSVIDGLTPVSNMRLYYRGFIRPIPPPLNFDSSSFYYYGLCVDAYYKEAWWEGVVFDDENASEVRSIFFPDIGDLLRIGVDKLRMTQDWDEYTQEWKLRGTWHLLELIEKFRQENLLCVSIRQIWYEIREKKDFQILKEWTNSVTGRDVWENLLRDLIDDHSKLAAEKYCAEVAESMLPGDYKHQLEKLNATDDNDDSGTEVNAVVLGTDVKEIHGNGLNVVCNQLSSNRKSKRKWEIAGKDIAPEAEFCPGSIVEYLRNSNFKCRRKSAKLKLRKHLAYLGWKVEICREDDKPRMRYTSPDGKTYMSLATVCKDLVTSTDQGEEKNVFASSPPSHALVSFLPPIDVESSSNISTEPRQDLATGDGANGKLIASERIPASILVEHAEIGQAKSVPVEEHLHDGTYGVPPLTSNDNDAGAEVVVVPLVTEEEEVHVNHFMTKSNAQEEDKKLDISFSSRSSSGIHVEVFPSAQSTDHNKSFRSQDSNPVSDDFCSRIFERLVEKRDHYGCQITEHDIGIIPEAEICPYSIYKLKMEGLGRLDLSSIPNSETTQEETRCSLPSVVPCNSAAVDEFSKSDDLHIVGKELPGSKMKKRKWEIAGTDIVPEVEICSSHASSPLPHDIVEPANFIEPVKHYALLGSEEKINNTAWPGNDNPEDVQENGNKPLMGCERSIWTKEAEKQVPRDTLPSGSINNSLSIACEALADGEVNNGFQKALVSEPKRNLNVADEALCKLIAIQRFPSSLHTELVEFEKEKSLAIGEHLNEGMDGVPPLVDNSLVQTIGQETRCSENKEKKEFALMPSAKVRSDTDDEYCREISVRQLDSSMSSHNRQSSFSMLIDSDLVSPRAKVYYLERKSGARLKEGQITREGIICSCCQNVFGLSKFEAHAGSTYRRPAASIFLEDGRSLSECQLQLCRGNLKNKLTPPHQPKNNRDDIKSIMTPSRQPQSNPKNIKNIATSPQSKRSRRLSTNDCICSICNLGGQLTFCNHCPSSFHRECLGLKVIPDGVWFCPSCCCGICGRNKFNSGAKQIMEGSVLNCHQCERNYHVGCLLKQGDLNMDMCKGRWFCNKKCEQIFLNLRKLLGRPVVVGNDNLTWTLLKYTANNDDLDDDVMDSVEILSNLNLAVSAMHECFNPVKEPRTRIDIVKDVIFSRGSILKRLNFQGFYTVLLSRDDELISVAAVRVYGEKVAEVPLICTRFQYRRHGMCGLLMKVLEKKLMELGVERLVVPATPNVISTWTASFGLSKITESERLNLLSYTFLDFQSTDMYHKLLAKSAQPLITQQNIYDGISGSDNAGINRKNVSLEVFQAEQTEAGIMYQGAAKAATSSVNGGIRTLPLILRV